MNTRMYMQMCIHYIVYAILEKKYMKDCFRNKEKFWYIINFSFCKIKIFKIIHYRCVPINKCYSKTFYVPK